MIQPISPNDMVKTQRITENDAPLILWLNLEIQRTWGRTEPTAAFIVGDSIEENLGKRKELILDLFKEHGWEISLFRKHSLENYKFTRGKHCVPPPKILNRD